MKSNYDLIVLSLSGAEKFSHIIKENQRLTEQGVALLTTIWFKTQKYVRNEPGEVFHPVLASPTRLGVDLIGECTELHPENPLFSSGKIRDLNGQIATNAQRSNLRACPYDRATLAAICQMRDDKEGSDWDDGLVDFTEQTYVELFYDVEKNIGVIYRATDMASGEQLELCLGDDVRGYGPLRLDVLPEEIRKCPNLVSVLPEFNF